MRLSAIVGSSCTLSSKTPLELLAIGYGYEDFDEDFEQRSDEEVAELIERSRGAKVGEINDSDT